MRALAINNPHHQEKNIHIKWNLHQYLFTEHLELSLYSNKYLGHISIFPALFEMWTQDKILSGVFCKTWLQSHFFPVFTKAKWVDKKKLFVEGCRTVIFCSN